MISLTHITLHSLLIYIKYFKKLKCVQLINTNPWLFTYQDMIKILITIS